MSGAIVSAGRRRHFWPRRLASPSATVGAILVIAVIAIALIGPFVAPYSPTSFVGASFAPPSLGFPLGTDDLGRDALSRVLWGGYRIIGLAVIATALGVLTGAMIGVISGYLGRAVDETLMRLVDVAMAFPQIILVLLFISIIGAKLWLLTVMVAAVHAPQVARVARAATLRVAQEDFVRFAEAIGTPLRRIVAFELFPNIVAQLMVECGLRFAYSISLIAGLNFLGFGVQPPAADWGLMINENRIGLLSNPWPVLAPILLIAVLTIGMNLLTDTLARTELGHGIEAGPEAGVEMEQ
ncbi:MAG TPA: ABC transporter permease [Acidiphilium sp.]